MKREDLKTILLIGAGPIVIGQGCEFDYSGVQAVKALKGEGYRVVLVNSNPATVMTDPDRSDATYIEPLTVDSLSAIIAKERPDALLPTLGGQTALNLAMELDRKGVLAKYGVEMIGASAKAIDTAEDRNLFKAAMERLGLDLPRSGSAHSLDEAKAVAARIGSWPLIIRPGFTRGGTGGGIAHDGEEFERIVVGGLAASLNHEVLVEESLIGWKEYEMEVMRDKAGNAVIVCSIENLDPMGVHTGDSITVAPILTLTDREYQAMRDDSIAVLREIGIETGGSNVQWAVDPRTGRRIIIEMNPRVSRSSALASKATGFPIAKIAALLAVGYTLDELKNDITRVTPACFEPALDYVVVKMPRFAFEKFPGANAKLGTQMKSVGETMAIGRTFKEAYRKALRSLEVANPLKYHDRSAFDPWFQRQLDEMDAYEAWLGTLGPDEVTPGIVRQAKSMGFSDAELAKALRIDEGEVRTKRLKWGVRPSFGVVDTCAGEFKAVTPYYYSSYEPGTDDHRELRRKQPPAQGGAMRRKIMVLGGGPNRIGQGIEFDWCCCHAAFALRERGYEVVMVNSNPETVSTDYDTSDRLYFEPLTFEDVMEIYDHERCDGVIVQFGGQTPLNLAQRLKAAGANVVGTSPDDIDRAEDRDFFRALVDEVGMRQPPSGIAHTVDDARSIAERIGYPVLVRPSFVIGGRGMAICRDAGELGKFVGAAVEAGGSEAPSGGSKAPILIDKFLRRAIELDVDCVSDGETTVIGAILEHVEPAGCHSGDSASITPPMSLRPETIAEIRAYAHIFARRLRVCGLMNLQLAVVNEEGTPGGRQVLYMIEVNPRASRTVPFVSKAIGVSLAGVAARCMAGETLREIGFTHEITPPCVCVKEAVFPFARFPGADITLSPEMHSTGEVMAMGDDGDLAYLKSQTAAGTPVPSGDFIFVAIPRDRQDAALRLIASREAKWIVDVNHSDIQLRSAAVANGIPVTTTLAGFKAAICGVADEYGAFAHPPVSLQERRR